MTDNGTMLQFFHYFYPISEPLLWEVIKDSAGKLKDDGITAVWMPPATKGSSHIYSNGYDPYDLYDLGEFNREGEERTKFGNRKQYIDAIKTLHRKKIHVYADIVLNHKAGAPKPDGLEWVKAVKVKGDDREFVISGDDWIQAFTHFTFPERGDKYSDFIWRWYHFDGVDWNENTLESAIYKFLGRGKDWDAMVDDENGNYDYLMFSDIDFDHPEVRTELHKWGKWYLNSSDIDGFRIDAVKHIKFSFFRYWLDDLRSSTGKELFSVGEYLSFDLNKLLHYLDHTHYKMSLFDFPLFGRIHQASHAQFGAYDMRTIFDDTLVSRVPTHAVTFTQNHDYQPLREQEMPIAWWFKPIAYALILLREQGYPCVFAPDYMGAEYKGKGHDGNEYTVTMAEVPGLRKMLKVRNLYSYGYQHDYVKSDMYNQHIIGWTREGDTLHVNSGIAVVLSNGPGGSRRMYIGNKFTGQSFYDYLGNVPGNVTIDKDGHGDFYCTGGSVSVWVISNIRD